MTAVKLITPGFVYQLTDEQVKAANAMAVEKPVCIWKIDDIVAIGFDNPNEPTHWWRDGEWVAITISLTSPYK